MQLPLYIVDAFTNRLFHGNPAAVCPLTAWLPDKVLQQIAAENNLAETAFLVPDGAGWHLRWLTPCVEVDLCGHATLARQVSARGGELQCELAGARVKMGGRAVLYSQGSLFLPQPI